MRKHQPFLVCAKTRSEAKKLARRILKKNPPEKKSFVNIYKRVLQIDAQKGIPHQNCDAECRRFNHRYTHSFRSGKARMLGLSPGQTYRVPKGKWPLLITD